MNDQTQATKTINWIIFLALGIVAFGIGLFLYWRFANADVLDIKNAPFPVRTIREHPTADGVVILKVDYCKKVEAKGRLRTSFVSATREVFLPASEENQPPRCLKTEVPVLIPHEIPEDNYRVRFRIDYQLNPVKSVIEEFDSQEFHVDETER